MGIVANGFISSGGGYKFSQFQPDATPIGHNRYRNRFVVIDAITAVLGKLLNRLMIGKDIAMDATQ